MSERFPTDVYEKYQFCKNNWQPIDLITANTIATILKDWAIEHGATHWCHWFQPLVNGHFAEKHEAFIDIRNGSIITHFSGSDLVLQEPDASSFPSGGLRSTHLARGYTIWDPLSPIFIKDVDESKVMCIPSCFISWTGEALDRKIPLLRSIACLRESVKKIFVAAGKTEPKSVRVNSGLEQEFYIIDKKHFDERPDLRITGRTVQGSQPFKNQELCDHYLASIPRRAVNCIHEVEREAWRLGIPLKTRHQEVAPNQFETAPIFEQSSVASDQNLILMDLMRNIASKHGLMFLFHEKPFIGYNGNGKHNNWSIGTDSVTSIFKPENMKNNIIFKLALAAVIRGIDVHQDLIRYSISGASNDFRLGAHEAPPSIISIFLGDTLSNYVDSIITGKEYKDIDVRMNIGIPYLTPFERHSTDRNRTSPFAFTVNKFEFRAVGSSQNPSISNYILNTIISESFDYLTEEIEALKKKNNIPAEEAAEEVFKRTLINHQRIIFDGDGYSQDWLNEAERRGLLNLRTTYEVLEHVNNEKNLILFEKQKVLSQKEFLAHLNADAQNYTSTIEMEARSLITISNKYVIPTAFKYMQKMIPIKNDTPKEFSEIHKLFDSLQKGIDNSLHISHILEEMFERCDKLEGMNPVEKAKWVGINFLPIMKNMRKELDSLEEIVSTEDWPIPSYEDILFHKLN